MPVKRSLKKVWRSQSGSGERPGRRFTVNSRSARCKKQRTTGTAPWLFTLSPSAVCQESFVITSIWTEVKQSSPALRSAEAVTILISLLFRLKIENAAYLTAGIHRYTRTPFHSTPDRFRLVSYRIGSFRARVWVRAASVQRSLVRLSVNCFFSEFRDYCLNVSFRYSLSVTVSPQNTFFVSGLALGLDRK